MNKLSVRLNEIFTSNDISIRVESDENGEPLFNANDAATRLGYANPRQALSDNVDGDDVRKADIIDSLGRKQQANYLTESGLYQLITGSTLPSAKEFKKWLFGEVLPSIRKTGSYSVAPKEFTPEVDRFAQFLIDNGANKTRVMTSLALTYEKAGHNVTLLRDAIPTTPAEDMPDLIPAGLANLISLETGTKISSQRINNELIALGLQLRIMNGRSVEYKLTPEGDKYAEMGKATFETPHGDKEKPKVLWKRSVLPLLKAAILTK